MSFAGGLTTKLAGIGKFVADGLKNHVSPVRFWPSAQKKSLGNGATRVGIIPVVTIALRESVVLRTPSSSSQTSTIEVTLTARELREWQPTGFQIGGPDESDVRKMLRAKGLDPDGRPLTGWADLSGDGAMHFRGRRLVGGGS